MSRNLAVIGGGYWGKKLIRSFNELGALRVICDTSLELLKGYADQYPEAGLATSYQDVLTNPNIDVVVIATPAVTHYTLAKEALNAGKAVFVEKPLALRRAEGEELTALAEERKQILMVGHILQYHPAVRKIKELITSGYVGKLQYIYSNRLNIGKFRSEENILWSFAPHDISVMLMLLGESPVSVHAQGGNYVNHNVADVTMTTLSFASGVRGHIFVSWLHPYKEQRLVVVGDRKMLVFDDSEPQNKLKAYAHQVEWVDRKPMAQKGEAEVIPVSSDEPLKLECAHFLDCIASHKTPITDGREGLAVLSVLEACQEALDKNGVAVSIESPTPKPDYFVHQSCSVDGPCEIGTGTKIWHFSHVLKGTRIGKNCSIGQNASIGPDVTIGNNVKVQNNVSIYQGVTLEDEVFCGPSMVFTNVINPRSGIRRMHELKPTVVKRGASIGANATIVCGHTLGRYCFVGAGAVVTKDVPDHALVYGNPAKIRGWMCECGVQLEFQKVGKAETGYCKSCSMVYTKHGETLQAHEKPIAVEAAR
jgi:UDP-2-acetamido-3-amino-2,3-dideoxy-glucuronate N-acetyltransferase